MDGPRDQLLAGAGLPEDQAGGVAARGRSRPLEHRPHARRVGGDALEAVGVLHQAVQALHAIAQLGGVEDPLHLLEEQLLGEGHRHEVLRPSADDLGGELDRGRAREDEHRDVGPVLLHGGEQPQCGLAGVMAEDHQAKGWPNVETPGEPHGGFDHDGNLVLL